MSDLALLLSEPPVERRAFERRAKREIQQMNVWASAIHGKKLSGERIANLEKMSECPALGLLQYNFLRFLAEGVVHENALFVSSSLLHSPSSILNSLPSIEAASVNSSSQLPESVSSRSLLLMVQNL